MSDNYFLRDLERCTSLFERLGLSTTIYAFPNGSYRPDQVKILRRRGFSAVLLVEEQPTWPMSAVHAAHPSWPFGTRGHGQSCRLRHAAITDPPRASLSHA
jgi:hypothetical protein